MTVSKKITLIIGLFLSVLTGCSPIPADESPITEYLPDMSTLKGWKMIGNPQLAEGMNLFSIINGEAELYISRGFKRAILASYLSATGREIYIQIFEMKDTSAAKQVFEAKSNQGISKNLGDAAILEDYYLNFRKAAFQITVSGAIPNKTDKLELEVLSREIASKIPD